MIFPVLGRASYTPDAIVPEAGCACRHARTPDHIEMAHLDTADNLRYAQWHYVQN